MQVQSASIILMLQSTFHLKCIRPREQQQQQQQQSCHFSPDSYRARHATPAAVENTFKLAKRHGFSPPFTPSKHSPVFAPEQHFRPPPTAHTASQPKNNGFTPLGRGGSTSFELKCFRVWQEHHLLDIPNRRRQPRAAHTRACVRGERICLSATLCRTLT